MFKFKKHPVLYNGVFGCYGNTCHVIWMCAFFRMLHIYRIGPINVCTNFKINRYKIDEFIKHA